MGWTADFMSKRRAAWLRRIAKAQYYTDGSWVDGNITKKNVSDENVVVMFEATDGKSTSITQMRLIDEDGSVAYTVNVNIQRSTSRRGALLKIQSKITAT